MQMQPTCQRYILFLYNPFNLTLCQCGVFEIALTAMDVLIFYWCVTNYNKQWLKTTHYLTVSVREKPGHDFAESSALDLTRL